MVGTLPLITQMMYIGGAIPLNLINPEHVNGMYLTSYHTDDVYRRYHTSY
jgi:hypothetical protein